MTTTMDYYSLYREQARRRSAYAHACDRSRHALNRYNADRTPTNRALLDKAIQECDEKFAAIQALDSVRVVD